MMIIMMIIYCFDENNAKIKKKSAPARRYHSNHTKIVKKNAPARQYHTKNAKTPTRRPPPWTKLCVRLALAKISSLGPVRASGTFN